MSLDLPRSNEPGTAIAHLASLIRRCMRPKRLSLLCHRRYVEVHRPPNFWFARRSATVFWGKATLPFEIRLN